MNTMRVAHLLRKFDPAEWGGTEMALQRLFDGLRAQGVESVVYCPHLERERAEDPLVRAGYRVERYRAFVPVVGISKQRRRQLIAVGGNLMSFNLISSLWREPDLSLVHTHALGRIGAIGRTVARQRRIPFVITIHGGVLDLPQHVKQSFDAPGDGGWEWGRVFGLLFQSHHLFRDADAIVTCNAREAALWRERFPAKPVIVQPHGVPLELYRKDHREAARAAYPQIRGRKVLLSAGRIDPVKNQGWLLEQAPRIFQKHPQALLVLAGACTDEPYGELIQREIQRLGIANQVLLTGGLPPNDPRLVGLMQEAAALLLPSVSETFGLVLLEAWAAGAMVLSSRTSGPSALIVDGQNGWLFDLDQPETFHRALDQTLADPAVAAEMAARGAAVAGEYSLEAVARPMKNLYGELIKKVACAT